MKIRDEHQQIPSGEHTKSYWSHGPVEIVVIFPWIAWWIFPLQTVSSPEGNQMWMSETHESSWIIDFHWLGACEWWCFIYVFQSLIRREHGKMIRCPRAAHAAVHVWVVYPYGFYQGVVSNCSELGRASQKVWSCLDNQMAHKKMRPSHWHGMGVAPRLILFSSWGHIEILGLGFGVAGTHHVCLRARKMCCRIGWKRGTFYMRSLQRSRVEMRRSRAKFAWDSTPLLSTKLTLWRFDDLRYLRSH